MRVFSYESMGTKWIIKISDVISPAEFEAIGQSIQDKSAQFDAAYSRFSSQSLIRKLNKPGQYTIPGELFAMLRLYEKLHEVTSGKINPLVGQTLEDLGYDAGYSFNQKKPITKTPDFKKAINLLEKNRILITEPVLIDIGALGKGYFVDLIVAFLRKEGITNFLVDGSGDMYYQSSENRTLKIGLEDPSDETKVIAKVDFSGGAMCSSAGNRRKWRQYHHIIDPISSESPKDILATWVIAQNTALADGLATSLFLVSPETLLPHYDFEYLIFNTARRVKQSQGFHALLF